MKFTPTTTDDTTREPMAWLDEDGDLIIRDTQGSSHIMITRRSGLIYAEGTDLDNSKKVDCFFKGDSVTITF